MIDTLYPDLCSVPSADFMSTVGGYLNNVGDNLSTVVDVQCHGGHHDKCGGYLEHHEGCSVTWGDIMCTVGVFSAVKEISSFVI